MSTSKRRKNIKNETSVFAAPDDLPPLSLSDVGDVVYGTNATARDDGKVLVLSDEHNEMRFGKFALSSVGFQMPEKSDREDWQALGQLLFRLDGAIQWLIGDWLVYGETHQWGDTAQIAADFGYETATLYDYAKTARNVQIGVRTPILSFGHHRVVRYHSPEEQRYWLARAQQEQWSVKRLREAIKALKAPNPPAPPPLNEAQSAFSRVFDAVGQGYIPNSADVKTLRRWLNSLENLS